MHITPNFHDTVKKFANISDLSARLETSSGTVRQSSSIFSLNYFCCNYYFFCICSNKSSNSSIVSTYLKSTFSFTKHYLIPSSLSFESNILEAQIISFRLPNILFLAKFCTKVVFLQPVLPTTKLYQNLPVNQFFLKNSQNLDLTILFLFLFAFYLNIYFQIF